MILTKEKIILNDEQKSLLEIMENTDKNLFITGKAGTGKSTLLQEFKHLSVKKIVLVAPTGVAALNIGGQTIHSLFRIKPSEYIDPKQLKTPKTTKELLSKIETLIIDEISMVRADLIDAIDEILRFSKKSSEPFGGVQVIMFGDLFQLPPIIKDRSIEHFFQKNYNGIYFFNAKVWIDSDLEIHELKTNIRQEKDELFLRILNGVRNKRLSSDLMAKLNQRAGLKPKSKDFITLALTNKVVNDINEKELKALKTQEYKYEAEITGKLNSSEFPTEKTLRLKKNAQVMFLKNDREKRYVNGSIGKVTYLSDKVIEVEVDNKLVNVKKESWEKIKYNFDLTTNKIEEEVISSFNQFPLKLAWAITVHKSQGQTLDNVVLDMGNGAFAHGQTYVALSRCRNLENLYLKRSIKNRDLIVDPQVLEFLA